MLKAAFLALLATLLVCANTPATWARLPDVHSSTDMPAHLLGASPACAWRGRSAPPEGPRASVIASIRSPAVSRFTAGSISSTNLEPKFAQLIADKSSPPNVGALTA